MGSAVCIFLGPACSFIVLLILDLRISLDSNAPSFARQKTQGTKSETENDTDLLYLCMDKKVLYRQNTLHLSQLHISHYSSYVISSSLVYFKKHIQTHYSARNFTKHIAIDHQATLPVSISGSSLIVLLQVSLPVLHDT